MDVVYLPVVHYYITPLVYFNASDVFRVYNLSFCNSVDGFNFFDLCRIYSGFISGSAMADNSRIPYCFWISYSSISFIGILNLEE